VSVGIIGMGEPSAGDDAVGLAVVERLRAATLPPDVKLAALRDPSELATLLPGLRRALIVDALLDPDHAGEVRLAESGMFLAAPSPSSHGVDAVTAVELGRTLYGASGFPEISWLTVSIERPSRFSEGLSPTVCGALDRAVQRAMAWLGDEHA
jgi:hydrogenase maturation protease